MYAWHVYYFGRIVGVNVSCSVYICSCGECWWGGCGMHGV
jgi:hypothetical protein